MGPNVSETCNSFGGKNVDCSCQRLETVKEAGVVAGVVRVVAGDVIFTVCFFCILLRKGYFADFGYSRLSLVLVVRPSKVAGVGLGGWYGWS